MTGSQFLTPQVRPFCYLLLFATNTDTEEINAYGVDLLHMEAAPALTAQAKTMRSNA